MKQMVEIGREIFASRAFSKVLTGKELLPGPGVKTADDLLMFVRERSDSYHHQVGSCKMGRDAMAVVDTNLRVYASRACASLTPALCRM